MAHTTQLICVSVYVGGERLDLIIASMAQSGGLERRNDLVIWSIVGVLAPKV